jgi:hypothetical protein
MRAIDQSEGQTRLSLTVGPREHSAPAPAASIGAPKDSEPNFLEPIVQSPWQYLPTTRDMDELSLVYGDRAETVNLGQTVTGTQRDDAFPSLCRARQF